MPHPTERGDSDYVMLLFALCLFVAVVLGVVGGIAARGGI